MKDPKKPKEYFMARYGKASHIHDLIKRGSVNLVMAAGMFSKNPEFGSDHVEAMVNSPHENMRHLATRMGSVVSDDQLHRLGKDPDNFIANEAKRNLMSRMSDTDLKKMVVDPANNEDTQKSAFHLARERNIYKTKEFKALLNHPVKDVRIYSHYHAGLGVSPEVAGGNK